ncbi:MAG: TraB/GumN family protein [Saprospiraceae bacterium]|nr:TraB/GumN family protein [Saprospiraceae bacterium]
MIRYCAILTLFLFLFSQLIIAQSPTNSDKKNYSLLWEISGNGLEKPSYLFGTMHLRDKRVFEFPDSLPIYFEQTDAFAMEVSTDSMLIFIMEIILKGDTTNKIQRMLDPAAYANVNQAVKEKTGSSIDALDIKDPLIIELLLSEFSEPDSTEKNDIFLDLYLYKLAVEAAKPVYGLERATDYQNVTRSFFNQFTKSSDATKTLQTDENQVFEEWVKKYQSGDLKLIADAVAHSANDSAYEYQLLNARNFKMADNFESLFRKQSIFCAVGAAHLAGDDGLINLLKQRGYRVRKVNATFTDKAKNYAYKKVERKWITIDNKPLAVSYAFPTKPLHIPTFDLLDDSRDFSFTLNFLDLNAYMFVSFPNVLKDKTSVKDVSFYRKALDDSNFNNIKGKIKSEKLKLDGIYGFQFIGTPDEGKGESVFQVFERDNQIYIFGIYRDEGNISHLDRQAFFNSIQFSDLKKESWIAYNNPIGGFSVDLPQNPQYKFIQQAVDFSDGMIRDYHLHLYTAGDRQTGVIFYVRYNNFPINRTVGNGEAVLDESMTSLYHSFTPPITKPEKTTFKGYPCRSAIFVTKGKEIWVKLVLRGNRMYLLMVESTFGNKPIQGKDRFFESFTFEPLSEMETKEEVLDKLGFKANFPKNTITHFDARDTFDDYPQLRELNYSSQDTLSGVNFSVNKYEYFPYFYVTDTSEYFHSISESLKLDSTIIYFIDTTFANQKAWYVIYQEKPSTTLAYDMMFFNGGEFWELLVYAPDQSYTEKAFDFFNSFELLEWKNNESFVSPKAALLLKDLQSTDSTTQLLAKYAMDEFNFDEKELPLIYDVLNQESPTDSFTLYEKLLYREFQYTKDEKSVSFLEKEYKEKQGNTDAQKSILGTLSNMKTNESIEAFLKLSKDFRKDSFDYFVYNDLFQPFADSMIFVRNYLPAFLELRANRAFNYYIYNVLFNNASSDSLLNDMLNPYVEEFIVAGNEIISKYPFFEEVDHIKEVEKYWHLDAINILLGHLQTNPKIQSYLRNLQKIKDPHLLATIIEALLKHEEVVEPQIWDTVKASPYAWYILVKDLVSNRTDYAIPPDLLDQESIVKAYLEYDLDEFYGNYEDYIILDKRLYEHENVMLVNYLVSLKVESTAKTYLGIVSQPEDSADVHLYPLISIYSDEGLTEDNLEEYYQATLEKWRNQNKN